MQVLPQRGVCARPACAFEILTHHLLLQLVYIHFVFVFVVLFFSFFSLECNHTFTHALHTTGSEKGLRHMMKPNTKTEMFKMCEDAGFKDLHVFWQNFNFYGVIALK